MKAVIATVFLALFALAGVQAQYAAPPPAAGGLGGACGMYLSACCPGDNSMPKTGFNNQVLGTCNRGFVCTTGLAATPVCYTPRCTNTQQCMTYAYWTECVVDQMNCNACGFCGQKQCSIQPGRDNPCYQGSPSGGYCVCGETAPAPPAYQPAPVEEPEPAPEPEYEPSYPPPPPATSAY